MKANELMVGDWLYSIIDRYDHIEKKLCKITGIRTDCDTPLIQCDDTDVWYPLESYEPIYLTQEILEKNGFTRFARTNWHVDTYRPFYLDNPSNPNDYKDNYWLRVGDCMNRIEYVHELQHALRLCGIKKEIVL